MSIRRRVQAGLAAAVVIAAPIAVADWRLALAVFLTATGVTGIVAWWHLREGRRQGRRQSQG